ncbi:hypothetical protein J6590_015131 [Homalodisca vitripennis]|nr:hypothetical protein J6590_015131 [Homalodisca vitripennis]
MNMVMLGGSDFLSQPVSRLQYHKLGERSVVRGDTVRVSMVRFRMLDISSALVRILLDDHII